MPPPRTPSRRNTHLAALGAAQVLQLEAGRALLEELHEPELHRVHVVHGPAGAAPAVLRVGCGGARVPAEVQVAGPASKNILIKQEHVLPEGLAGLVEAQRRGVKRPLQLCLSRDEEIGCTGAPPMIEAMQAHMPKAALAIIGEPTEWGIVNGHKGGVGIDLHFHGFEVHSSIAYTGVSAIMEAAKLIDWANRVNAENAAKADPACDYDPPYTTLHVGMIQGGTAHNITAKDCTFVLTARCIPQEPNAEWYDRMMAEIDKIAAGMKAVRPEAGITATPRWDVPGLRAEQDGMAEALIRRLTGENGTSVVSYGTEAGQFQAAGYSAIICGPGNIAQAHQPNEYMYVEQLTKGQAFMARLLDMLDEG